MVFRNLIRRVVGDPNERDLRRYDPTVKDINDLASEIEALDNEELRAKTDEFKARLAEGKKAGEDVDDSLEDILPEAFAVVRAAAMRTIKQRHFDEQLIGGIVLHQGKIAEMKTGEGKTLVASLPLYLNALAGKGAHLVTPNDYLSKVGLQMMGPIYHLLGLKAAVIQNAAADPSRGSFLYDPNFRSDDERYQHLRPIPRREAYDADITYGTNNEFGFDYLRDNMVRSVDEMVQRGHHYAIVDEVDNILIDEARTPLIISGTSDKPSEFYGLFARLVKILTGSSEHSIDDEDPDGDYVEDPKTKTVYLTEAGIIKIENALRSAKVLQGEDLYDPDNSEMLPYLDNSLRAMVVYHRDKDYMVEQGQVIIVDEFTGRPMYGRRFAEGLHQAIEAKEGVQVQRENLTLATITFQNYFRMYEKLAGMTGTAMTEADEFLEIYKLDVVAIPTHLECIRKDLEDLVYMTEDAKWAAVVKDIKTRSDNGQPILVGTVAIETSEHLSKLLKNAKVDHEVLNAKQHEREAIIIAQAGRPGAVTIATNMAGRGVDILLGGNPDGLARETLRKMGIEITDATPEQEKDALDNAKKEVDQDRVKVIAKGGLHVIGTERHEARRIDNQLRGRSGRQGDPGSSRFYLSLEDDLMRRFGGDRVKGFMKTFKMPEGEPIEHGLITKSIQQAQVKVEGYNFDIRKRVLEYDDVVNKQREVIYGQRQQILYTEGFLRILEQLLDQTNDLSETVDGLEKPAASAEPVDTAQAPADGAISGEPAEKRSAEPQKPTPLEALREDLRVLTNLVRAKEDKSATAIARLIERLGELDQRAKQGSLKNSQLDEQLDDIRDEATELLKEYDLREQIQRMTSDEIAELIDQFLPKDHEAWELDALYQAARLLYPIPEGIRPQRWQTMTPEDIAVELNKGAMEIYDALEKKFTPKIMRIAERQAMLRAIDQYWIRHLTDLDVLREGIGLVAIGQRDPLVEYKRDAYKMWSELQSQIQHEIVHFIYQIDLAVQPQQATLNVRNIHEGPASNGGSMQGMPRPQPVMDSAPEPQHADVWDRTGRNDPCPCGSGRKYKNCHYRQVQEQRKAMSGGGKRYR